jgi:hypothetical protein
LWKSSGKAPQTRVGIDAGWEQRLSRIRQICYKSTTYLRCSALSADHGLQTRMKSG